ncbi:MAG TPA: PIG-L deacetylase family protein [Candidatus Saccharimonadales bacterium]|nr:PIG-L deacetylase family protein [Candidatus Saccharimonadales bacterium]
MASVQPYDPKIVLAIGAHADDIDFGASGSVAAWVAKGAEVHYLVITDGSKGSADTGMATEQLVAMRQQEQRDAAAVLGVKEVHFLGYEDGMLEVTMDLKKDIVRLIRQIRPDTVVVMDPTTVYYADYNFINHPDHRAAGQATLDAVFPLARDHLSFPELYLGEKLEPHKVAHVLLINLEKQNYYVDISATFDTKVQALQRHASQVPSVQALTEMLQQRAAALGRKTGSQYAEGFVRIDTQA